MTPAKLTMFLLLAVGLLVAVYVGKKLMATEEVVEAPPTARTVPLAASDLESGTIITEEHLVNGPTREITRDMVLNSNSLIGRVVKNKIDRTKPFKIDDLYPVNEFPPLGVSPGNRALAIPIGEGTSLVDGLIRPGEYVDMQIIPNNRRETDDVQSRTFLKGIKVLAINKNFVQTDIDRGTNTVVLDLTPRQVNLVNLARSVGTITLTHNPDGESAVNLDSGDTDIVTMADLLGEEPQPVEEPEPPKPFETQVFMGTNQNSSYWRNGVRVNWNRGTGRDDDDVIRTWKDIDDLQNPDNDYDNDRPARTNRAPQNNQQAPQNAPSQQNTTQNNSVRNNQQNQMNPNNYPPTIVAPGQSYPQVHPFSLEPPRIQ